MNAVNNEIMKYEDRILNEINSVDVSYKKIVIDNINEKEDLIKTKKSFDKGKRSL